MSKRIWLFGLLAAWLTPGAAAAPAPQGAEERLLIAFKQGVSALEQQKALQTRGLKIIDEIPEINVVLAQAQAGQAAAALTGISADPSVLRAEKDLWREWLIKPLVSPQEAPLPSVESILRQLPKMRPAGLPRPEVGEEEAQWGVKRVNAPAAWPTNQGAGVKVAIIDTGIDPEHPELKGRVAGGINAIDEKASWADDHFHGTHVAGIVAAVLDGKGVAGVAPRAELYAVKVLSKDGAGNLFAIMKGVMWCAQNGIQVANMSLGAPQEIPFLQYALQHAKSAGVTIVAAAGNDGKAVNFPAAYPETIAVSALCPPGIAQAKLCPSAQEGIATFSSRGPQVAFIAPGVLIPSTVPASHDASGIKPYSGTSMATPHVAGLAALAVAKGAADPAAVLAALKDAAQKLPDLGASEQGSGVINAAKLSR